MFKWKKINLSFYIVLFLSSTSLYVYAGNLSSYTYNKKSKTAEANIIMPRVSLGLINPDKMPEKVIIEISHPGSATGFCHLEIWAEPKPGKKQVSISKLIEQLKVRLFPDKSINFKVVNDNFATLDLRPYDDYYQVIVNISSLNKKPIPDTIKDVFGSYRNVFISPGSCRY